MPQADLLQTRTADVLRVVYLIFSEGHQASSGDDLLRPDLCVAGVNLARGLAARLPRDPEVLGLLALLLLTDARRATRTAPDGRMLLLEEQDRTRWDRAMSLRTDSRTSRYMRPASLRRPPLSKSCGSGAAISVTTPEPAAVSSGTWRIPRFARSCAPWRRSISSSVAGVPSSQRRVSVLLVPGSMSMRPASNAA